MFQAHRARTVACYTAGPALNVGTSCCPGGKVRSLHASGSTRSLPSGGRAEQRRAEQSSAEQSRAERAELRLEQAAADLAAASGDVSVAAAQQIYVSFRSLAVGWGSGPFYGNA